MRTILHVDMDAFFAAVEALDHPEYAGRPVIVGGTPEGHGVVCAASYEARAYGIHSAMPAARAVKLCPPGVGVYLRPRMARYEEVSDRIFAIFREYTPDVEALSVDEAFLDVTGSRRLFGDGRAIAERIKKRIRGEIGLTASVGVASNKFLAKLASDLEKPNGLVVVPGSNPAAFIAPLPVERVWGVGPATAKRLRGIGIRTISDLASCSPRELASAVGGAETAAYLQRLARGEDDRPVILDREAKSISSETTLVDFTDDPEVIRAILLDLSVAAARRMRRQGLACLAVRLKVRDERFHTLTRCASLPAPTAITDVIYRAAIELFRSRVEMRGRKVRLLGVAGARLVPAEEAETILFRDPREDKLRAVENAADAVAEAYGEDAIKRGRQVDARPRKRPG
jgi:DNA polymerase IV